jgi:hypothetical protein
MTADELDALPVVIPFETACKALSIGRNQGYRMLSERPPTFPVRVLKLCGRNKVSKFDLLAYLHAPVAEPADRTPVRLLRPVRDEGAGVSR